MGCVIGMLGCCFCGTAASLCCGCLPSCKNSTASRLMYGILLLFGSVLSTIALAPGVRNALSKIPALCSSIKIDIIDTGIRSGLDCDLLVGYGAVYRICFAMACFFFLFCMLMICVHSSRDPRSHIQNGFWFFKILLLLGLIVGAFFIPNSNFLFAWMVISMIGAFFYIFVQLVLIIDFSYCWNRAWLEGFREDGHRGYCIGLVFFTVLFYSAAIGAMVCLYIFYGANLSCHLNRFFITFNVILCVVVSVVSILPKVQERLSYSGLLQSSLVSMYVMYLTWAAMINSPDAVCNANIVVQNVTSSATGTSQLAVSLQFDWHIVVGLVVFYIIAIYSSIRSNAHTQAGKLTMAGNENTDLADQGEAPPSDNEATAGQQVWDNEKDGVAYSYSLFHGLFVLGAMYIQMTLTNWYAPQQADITRLGANVASMWVKIGSSWLCLALYLWTMVAPLIFSDREFQ